jgi:hypothetical protein
MREGASLTLSQRPEQSTPVHLTFQYRKEAMVNRRDDDSVQRSPEYYQFMEQLDKYLKQRGYFVILLKASVTCLNMFHQHQPAAGASIGWQTP